MSDTTDFKDRILNCIPSRGTELDWAFQDAIDGEALQVDESIPELKDLRESWWKINDQKNTGSCVGWATADSILRWHFVKAERLSQSQLLSPRFIWMASKETDRFRFRPTTFIEISGTSLKAALDVARKFGAAPESLLPFSSGGLYPGRPNTFYAKAAKFKIASYFSLGKRLRNWRKWIAFNGPILTRLNVDKTWYKATSNNGNLDSYKTETAGGGHAIALVGYTSDRFIVRNSWGNDWGDKGFGYASDSYAQKAFTEAYGVII